jgi:hypothetical protein
VIQFTGTADETNPQTKLDHATSGVVRIVDSAILSQESYFGNGIVSIGAGGPTSTGTLTNDVVIAGSIVAGGAPIGGGDGLIIRATRGVWIETSPIGFRTLGSSAISDIRTSPNQSQLSSTTPS